MAVTVGLVAIVYYLNLGRGVPWMFGLFVALVVAMNYAFTRTRWGRSMFAVGGNAEAARRAGINVRRIYLSAFMFCSGFAALGGVLSSARLASASQQAGTGDVNLNAIAAAVIGGTSLFGGRGIGLVGASRDHRHPVDRQRPDAAQPVVIAALHDHRRGPRHRRHRRLAGPPEPRSPRPRLDRNTVMPKGEQA